MLHVAPEPCLEARFKEVPRLEYVTADLEGRRAMVQMDITDLRYPDNVFDILYCSHVLEHIPDDRRAMQEMCRVLTPHGLAVIMVPVGREATFEDPSITEPDCRRRVFGGPDHVRRYGPDIIHRLEAAGFIASRFHPEDYLDAESIARFVPKGVVFSCHKRR